MILPILAFGYIFAMRAFLVYLPLYLEDGGLSQHKIGALVSVFQIAPLLLLIPFGIMGDRFRPRHLMVTGLLIFAGALFVSAKLSSFVPLLFVFVVVGLGGSLFTINCDSLYFKSITDRRRGMKLAWYSGIRAMGFGLGPFLAGYVLDANFMLLGNPMLVGVLSILPFIVISLFLWEVPAERIVLADYARDLRRKQVLVLAVIVFLFSYHFGVEATCFSLFLKHRLGQDNVAIGHTYLYIIMALAPAMIVAGSISDRAGHPNLLGLVAMGCSAVGNGAMLLVGSLGWLLVARFIHVIGDGAFIIFNRVAIASLFQRRRMGGGLGTLTTVGFIGSFLGAYTGGLIPGHVWPFYVAGVLAVVGMVVFLVSGISFSNRGESLRYAEGQAKVDAPQQGEY